MATKTFSVYESIEISKKKLKKHSRRKTLSVEDAITIIRYTDPVPLPYGVMANDLLKEMEKKKDIQIERINGEITGKSKITLMN